MDFATLELIIDASQAEEATDKLDDLTEAGKRAEKSTDDLSGSTREYSGAASRAAEQVARQAAATTAGRVALVGMTAATVAAVAATAVLIAAWRRRQEAMEEARKEIERINKSLDDLRERQRVNAYGPGGEWVEPLRAANEELIRMQTEARGAWGEFKEISSTIIQMTADAEGLWDAIVKSFEESDTGRGLRNISAAIMDIDRLTGGRIAKQIELNRLQAIEEQQARVVAAQREIIAEKIAASEVVEERLRRQREAEIREAARAFEDEISDLERGAELRLLSERHVLRALEIERDQLRIVRDVNAALGDRITAQERINRLAGITGGQMTPTLSVPGGMTPSGGSIIGPVEVPQGAAFTFQGPTEDEVRRFVETMDAVREITAGFGDLADALGEASPALSAFLRGVQDLTAGAARIREGQGMGGWLGAAATISGVMSAGAGLAQLFASLTDDSAERERREAIRHNTEALDRLRDSLSDSTLSRVTDMVEGRRILPIIGDYVGQDPQNFRSSIGPDTVRFVDKLLELSGIKVGPGWIDALDEWLRLSLGGIEATMKEDVETRIMLAEGRDEEVEAMKRQKERQEELAIAELLGNEALAERLRYLYELEDAEIAAVKAAEEAAKAQSIANFDVEISARRAALAGDNLAAMQIRGEAAIVAQIAEWEKLVASGHMTEDQLAALSDIMRDELADSIDAAAEAARRASEDFLGMLAVEDLMAAGDVGGAGILRAEQRRDKWIADAMEMFDGAQLVDVLETINRITQNTINSILRDEESRAAVGGRSIVDQEAERAVVRSARSITSVQAETLVNIAWSQLSIQQEMVRLLRRIAGGAFIESIDGELGNRTQGAQMAEGVVVIT